MAEPDVDQRGRRVIRADGRDGPPVCQRVDRAVVNRFGGVIGMAGVPSTADYGHRDILGNNCQACQNGRMGTMNISLPDEMKRFVDRQVREGAYAGASDYMRALIRKDKDVAKLRSLLQKGLDSGPPEPVTDAWFDDLRRRVRARKRKPG